MTKLISVSLIFGFLIGQPKTDKLLLKNSNSYYGTYLNTLNGKVYFKIDSNMEIDSVEIKKVQLLKLYSGTTVIQNGIQIGQQTIEDLAINKVRQLSSNTVKWTVLGVVSVPLSLITGSAYLSFSRKLSQSKDPILPAFFVGAGTILSVPYSLLGNDVKPLGLPKKLSNQEKVRYINTYEYQTKLSRRKSVLEGALIGSIATAMFFYLNTKVKIKFK